ncbi:riboflavin synthase domain-like protein [Jaminaea rosea]|uniref:Riboflavin synthase domain-like protein n=1 Tax=Jaminaea rosea TaxID=1569628 RepID=A0A316UU89_9BASI|nr:riboflavin synthase domain-like protein [Jaminaea rosea]PWN26665.1 riboflavin synthase domain-like protein [Jaminaea rosea]
MSNGLVDAAEASTAPRPRLRIIYASATGTAQDLAYRCGRLAQRNHFPVRIDDVERVHLDDLIEHDGDGGGGHVVVFLVATAGNGSFPPSATSLWSQLLSSSLPLGSTLQRLQFAIFGLGDSSYPRFCWPERMMRKRLVDLGAKEVERGEGDEQHYLGLDGTYQPFLAALFDRLNAQYPLPLGMEILPDDVALPPTLELRLLDECGDESQLLAPAASTTTRWLRLVKNERLTSPDHFQDVRLFEFEVPTDKEPDLNFIAGDVAALRPVNDLQSCLALLDRLGWTKDKDRFVQVWDTQSQRAISLPALTPTATKSQTTLLDYIQHHVTPFSALRPSLFPLLRPFATSDVEREKLAEFCTPGEGYEDAMEYGVRTKRTVWEVLDEFRSVQLPVARAAEVLGGEMREREFSIASSPSLTPRRIQLLVAIVQYRTRIRTPRRGVATRWLASLDPSDPTTPLIPVQLRPSTILRLPPDDSTPIICVGPGTGVAPLRGLILERIARGAGGKERNTVFLGCRSARDDKLLGDEWDQLHAQGHVAVHWAISRTNQEGKPRKGAREYVQDVLRRQGEAVWDQILLEGAWVYICGSSGKMPEGVREAVLDIAEEHGGLERDQAERFVSERLEAGGRWREECWS